MGNTVSELMQEMAEVKTFVKDKVAEGVRPVQEEVTRLAAVQVKAEGDLKELRRRQIDGGSQDGRLLVREGRFAGYDALDLALTRSIIIPRYRGQDGWSQAPIIQELKRAAASLLEMPPDALLAWEERQLRNRRMAYGYADASPGMLKFSREAAIWRAQLMALRVKALDSTTAAKGDELVATLEAAQLWMDVNLETVVLPVLVQVPMPSNPYDIPRQLGDVNWYPISENTQALTTDPATGKSTLTAYGLKSGVPFSDELDEDAIIAMVPELRRSMVVNAAEVIDDVLLNGDTTALNGINSDGATISTSTAGKAHFLLGFDGLIHLALVDNTAQRNDHNAAVSADMFNEILAKLGKYAAPRRRGDVVFISDVNTAIRSMSITEFETVDVAGARATLSSGEILVVYGKPYLHSEQMALADTDGKVTNAGNATDTGRVLVVNTSQWRVGFRRQITLEADREPGKGQTTLYVSLRIALVERSGTRSTATHTALQYDITGV